MSKQPNFIEDAHRIYLGDGSKAFQGFEVNEVLFEGTSPYQDVAMYSNDTLGTVLVLDGIVQITTADEFIYQEMMSHVPLFSHSDPKSVLVIGGGDGGILKKVLRHSSVEKVVMAEIDQMVIDACVAHMPSVNEGGAIYDDPRAELVVGDAAEYVKNTDQRFDVVIIDSTDPVGPGEKLFTAEFYSNLARILSDEAYVSTQGGVPFFQKGEVAGTLGALQQAGLSTDCYIAAIPTYYGGYMTMGFASTAPAVELPSLVDLQKRYAYAGFKAKHYSPAMHLASFVLPPWIAEDVDGVADMKEEAA
jgi:spermidine synthase